MEPFQYKILGTSHVAKGSVREIEHEIKSFQPDIVAIELDQNRLQALLTNQKTSFNPKIIAKIGLMGYVFGLIGHIAQQKIGKKLNIMPGKDMLTAFKLARKHDLKVALIDQNVQITLRNVSKNFSMKERLKLVGEILESIIFKKRAQEKAKKKLKNINFNLNEVPSDEIITTMIGNLKEEYPGLHKALVEDRNKFMANNLCKLIKKNPHQRILAVVGAGHKEEMVKLVEKKKSSWEYVGVTYEPVQINLNQK